MSCGHALTRLLGRDRCPHPVKELSFERSAAAPSHPPPPTPGAPGLQAGADVNGFSGYAHSPLLVALFTGDVALAERLIRLGADVNKPVRSRLWSGEPGGEGSKGASMCSPNASHAGAATSCALQLCKQARLSMRALGCGKPDPVAEANQLPNAALLSLAPAFTPASRHRRPG